LPRPVLDNLGRRSPAPQCSPLRPRRMKSERLGRSRSSPSTLNDELAPRSAWGSFAAIDIIELGKVGRPSSSSRLRGALITARAKGRDDSGDLLPTPDHIQFLATLNYA